MANKFIQPIIQPDILWLLAATLCLSTTVGISSKNPLMTELSIALKVFTANATVQHITM